MRPMPTKLKDEQVIENPLRSFFDLQKRACADVASDHKRARIEPVESAVTALSDAVAAFATQSSALVSTLDKAVAAFANQGATLVSATLVATAAPTLVAATPVATTTLVAATPAASTSVPEPPARRFRLQLLPNIYTLARTRPAKKPRRRALPPVNLQLLREIDLHEILKNPQLRHDILFDPALQFRPNLDGERGRRKKQVVDRYWAEVETECLAYAAKQFDSAKSRLPALFLTLREILLLLLPLKDRPAVQDVMDTDLLIQQLTQGTFDFVALAQWLAEVFKSHCAPMRDAWVDDMTRKFVQAQETQKVSLLVEGLRAVFAILEAMKLDVANHQIRILRPVLVDTAVEFEHDYFVQMVGRRKLDIRDLLAWYRKEWEKAGKPSGDTELRKVCVSAILLLFLCRNMVTEFPSLLTFDHARLVMLRADVRQVVCLRLCEVLFRELANKAGGRARAEEVRAEILAIVTDDSGNVKWTRNVGPIALQLSKKAAGTSGPPPDSLIEFAFGWLIKQIQPASEIYRLMEERVFRELAARVEKALEEESDGDEVGAVAGKVAVLARFHWSVFGGFYQEGLRDGEAEHGEAPTAADKAGETNAS